jgi:hypothetical protein
VIAYLSRKDARAQKYIVSSTRVGEQYEAAVFSELSEEPLAKCSGGTHNGAIVGLVKILR